MAWTGCGPQYPGVCSPGFQEVSCLPAAGLKPPANADVYRCSKPAPLYVPDPCIARNTGEMICPQSCGQEKRNLPNPWYDTNPVVDVEAHLYQPQQMGPPPVITAACRCPCFSHGPPCRTAIGPVTDLLQCPCTNRCRPRFQPRPWKKQDLYPKCLHHLYTPTQPYPECRQSCGRIWDCPGSDPNVGPKMAMFLACDDS